MTRDKLTAKIHELVNSHGHEWKTIAGILNDLGISTLKGKHWTDQSVRAFFKRTALRANRAKGKRQTY